MNLIQGNLIEAAKQGKFDILIHGCNCFCTMGAGIAQQIKRNFPEAFQVDQQTKSGDKGKLGTCTYTQHTQPIIVNAYTQYHYSFKQINIDYDAVRSCMQWIKDTYSGYKIGMPKIGCGLAGGDWNIVNSIIQEKLANEHVTIMFLEFGFPYSK